MYATVLQFKAWMLESEQAYAGTDAEANNLLLLSERDIDRAVGPRRRQSNGFKFGDPSGTNLTGLNADQATQLARATCAQAEFRLQVGRDFFIEDQRESTSGPDYSEQGRLPKIGPRARAELQEGGLLKLTGRLGRNR